MYAKGFSNVGGYFVYNCNILTPVYAAHKNADDENLMSRWILNNRDL